MVKLSSYTNRVVVVTGGNGNMGRAIIKKFESYGSKCFAIDLKGNSNVKVQKLDGKIGRAS